MYLEWQVALQALEAYVYECYTSSVLKRRVTQSLFCMYVCASVCARAHERERESARTISLVIQPCPMLNPWRHFGS